MFWGVLFIAIGVGWILQYYGIIPANFDFFWPVIFIVLGLSILLGKSKKWDGCGGWHRKD